MQAITFWFQGSIPEIVGIKQSTGRPLLRLKSRPKINSIFSGANFLLFQTEKVCAGRVSSLKIEAVLIYLRGSSPAGAGPVLVSVESSQSTEI